ncbi:low molecular weight protein-tyrosine-phosphatase [Thauera butanivorans]|uniref:low molecular weight protein-tyrosine-phosphatase n=1 Tax=Thauera butanivorans TaxID=86174 RepID=UPI0008397A20|nr:low molecular weight protein-tyrosine-phosphatase [Thauera butanivorans]
MVKILFVCSGNICRSPTAEGIARHYIQTGGLGGLIEVDSAGTHGYHVGEAPDPRARKAAQQRGYDLSDLRARKLHVSDFQRFDLVLAMDRGHMEYMQRMCPEVYLPRLGLFMSYARGSELDEVPDPYYGGPKGFDTVLDLCESGVRGLLESVTTQA